MNVYSSENFPKPKLKKARESIIHTNMNNRNLN